MQTTTSVMPGSFSALCALEPKLGYLLQEAYRSGRTTDWPALLSRLERLLGPGRLGGHHPVLSSRKALEAARAALLHEQYHGPMLDLQPRIEAAG